MKQRVSLKARAIALLAQREHSRGELRRKLLPHAAAACNNPGSIQANTAATLTEECLEKGIPSAQLAAPDSDPGPCLDKLLDWLEAHHYLSQERFVESRIHVRAPRFGNLRIRQELAQHGIALTPEAAQALKESEFSRAQEVWQRKFGTLPQDASARAKQMRFLSARGFSSEVIHQVMRVQADDD